MGDSEPDCAVSEDERVDPMSAAVEILQDQEKFELAMSKARYEQWLLLHSSGLTDEECDKFQAAPENIAHLKMTV